MTRTAKFITKLTIEERPIGSRNDIEYSRTLMMPDIADIMNSDLVGDMRGSVTHERFFAPVYRINHMDKNDVIHEAFIAYTKEVQELLEMPFDLIKEENEALKDMNIHLESVNKLFGGAIDTFHEQPWYKRMYQAMQGRIL